MDNPLDFYSKQEGFHELYEVVRTVVVDYDDRYFRIEVIKKHGAAKAAFTAWIWEEKENTWVHYPVVGGGFEDVDTALAQALGCLSGETLG